MGTNWREWLVFSARERKGILVLVVVVGIIYSVPFWVESKTLNKGNSGAEVLDQAVARLKEKTREDSVRYLSDKDPRSSSGQIYKRNQLYSRNQWDGSSPGKKLFNPKRLFYFNPNTIPEAEWRELGLSEKNAGTIMNFIAKGGRFRKPADLERIYGIPKEAAATLIPYVRIEESFAGGQQRYNKKYAGGYRHEYSSEQLNIESNNAAGMNNENSSNNPNGSGRGTFYKKTPPAEIDINKADSLAWTSLPGIGPRLSSRILAFRKKLGGFSNIEQVAQTYGLADSVYQEIRPYLIIRERTISKININQAPEETLAAHPYIRWQLAKQLIAYRKQHGSFASLNDLNKILTLQPEQLALLKEYIEF